MEKFNRGPYGLKGLKSWQAREGLGYQYTLLENGKKVAFVHEEGRGGELDVDFETKDASERLDTFVAGLPHQKNPYTGQMEPISTDIFLAELADDEDSMRRLKRQAKTKTLITLKSDNPEQYHVYNVPFSPAVKAKLMEKHGENFDQCLNEWFL